ncbi:MAG: replication initiator [Acidimicrobiales bacterium]
MAGEVSGRRGEVQRAFSVTFKALRSARQTHRRAERFERSGIALADDDALVVVSQWSYTGRGWRSRAERYLIAQGANEAAIARRLSHEERLLRPQPAQAVSE